MLWTLLLLTLVTNQVYCDAEADAVPVSKAEAHAEAVPEAGPKAGPVIITTAAYRRAPPPGLPPMSTMNHVHKKPMAMTMGLVEPEDPLMSSGSNDWPQYTEITRQDRELMMTDQQRQNDKFLKEVPKEYHNVAFKAKQARESFTEAKAFDDLMSGGYGFLDDKGQLRVVQNPNSLPKVQNVKKSFAEKHQKSVRNPKRMHSITNVRVPSQEAQPPVTEGQASVAKSILPNFGISFGIEPHEPEVYYKEISNGPPEIVYKEVPVEEISFSPAHFTRENKIETFDAFGPPYHDGDLINHEIGKRHPDPFAFDQPVVLETHHTLIPPGHDELNKGFEPSQPDFSLPNPGLPKQPKQITLHDVQYPDKQMDIMVFEPEQFSQPQFRAQAPKTNQRPFIGPLNRPKKTRDESSKGVGLRTTRPKERRQQKEKKENDPVKTFNQDFHAKLKSQDQSGTVGFQKISMNGVDVEFDITAKDQEKKRPALNGNRVRRKKKNQSKNRHKLDIRGERAKLKNERPEQNDTKDVILKEVKDETNKKRPERDFGHHHSAHKPTPPPIHHSTPLPHHFPAPSHPHPPFPPAHLPPVPPSPLSHPLPPHHLPPPGNFPGLIHDPSPLLPHILAHDDPIHVNIHIDPRDHTNPDLHHHPVKDVELFDILHGPGYYTTPRPTFPPFQATTTTTTTTTVIPIHLRPKKVPHNKPIHHHVPTPQPLPHIIHHSEPPKLRNKYSRPTVSTLPPIAKRPHYHHPSPHPRLKENITKAPLTNKYLQTTNSPQEVSTLAPRPKNHFVATTTLPPRQYGKYVTPSIVLNTIISSTDPNDLPKFHGPSYRDDQKPQAVIERPQVIGPQNFVTNEKRYEKPKSKTPYQYRVVSALPKRLRPHQRHGHHQREGDSTLSQEELAAKFEGNLIKTLPFKKKYVHHVTPKPVFVPHRPSPSAIPLKLPSPEDKELKVAKKHPVFRPTTVSPRKEVKKRHNHPFGPTPKPHSLARRPFSHALPPPLPTLPPPPSPSPSPSFAEGQPLSVAQSPDFDPKNLVADLAPTQSPVQQPAQPTIKRVVLPTRVKSGTLFKVGEEIKPTIKAETANPSTDFINEGQGQPQPPTFVPEGPFFEEVPAFDQSVRLPADLRVPEAPDTVLNFPDFQKQGPFFEEVQPFDQPLPFDSMRPGFVEDVSSFEPPQPDTNGQSGPPFQQPQLTLVEDNIRFSPSNTDDYQYDAQFESAEFSGFNHYDTDDMDYAGSNHEEKLELAPATQILPTPDVETIRRRFENMELMKLPKRS